MDWKNAKIAVATEDGSTVSSHFGRAPLYEVIRLVDGIVAGRERREKVGHDHFIGGEEQGGVDGAGREIRHRTMLSPIVDCQALVARGMGEGAVNHLRRANILPVLTGLRTIEEVLTAIHEGSLESDPSRIHQHHGRQNG
jgi:predicted Fe-Mo cluster-binding NifX family protein